MKRVVRSLRDKRELILNSFHAEGAISAGTVEVRQKSIPRNSTHFERGTERQPPLLFTFGCEAGRNVGA